MVGFDGDESHQIRSAKNHQQKQIQGFPRKSKDQTLPIGSRESFTWIILKTILCLVLDFQGFWFLKKKKRGLTTQWPLTSPPDPAPLSTTPAATMASIGRSGDLGNFQE